MEHRKILHKEHSLVQLFLFSRRLHCSRIYDLQYLNPSEEEAKAMNTSVIDLVDSQSKLDEDMNVGNRNAEIRVLVSSPLMTRSTT